MCGCAQCSVASAPSHELQPGGQVRVRRERYAQRGMTGHIEGPDERRQAQYGAGIAGLAEPGRHDG